MNDSAVTRRPLLLTGGLAVLALIAGLLFGLLPALLLALAGIVAALALLHKTPGPAALGAGLNIAVLLIIYVISILTGN
jgi:hypothetical protein